MQAIRQNISFLSFAQQGLAAALSLEAHPFISKPEAHRQLEYVEAYVRDLKCQCIAIEDHYIDRDHMEDHSVFYSKSLQAYPNYCRRVHFFSCSTTILQRELTRIRCLSTKRELRAASAEFSKEHYLGFSVIKPLKGCPVGRTVLRCFPPDAKGGFVRDFRCACECTAHLLGIRLSVTGLAFQQQDLGVSACATTALWSALQKARELEKSAAATPAQITIRASQHALPFGRPMPSEGLSLDQMCQAVHSLGYAPNLYRADTFDVSRALLYSTIRSGISPVLILEHPTLDQAHAVAAAGMKLYKKHVECLVDPKMDDRAGDLTAVYIHDDRFGPYLRADIQRRKQRLRLHLSLRNSSQTEDWYLSHILVPMHAKIRLSFGELRRAAIIIVGQVHAYRESVLAESSTVTSWETWVAKAHPYVESLMLAPNKSPDSVVLSLCSSVPFSRYLGVVRIEAKDLDPIDFLLDTTSTERNLHCLAIVRTATSRSQTANLTELLAHRYQCSVIS